MNWKCSLLALGHVLAITIILAEFTTTPSVLVFWNTSWFGFGHSCSFTNFSLSIEVKIREITSRYVLDHQPLCIGFLHWFTSRDVLDSYYNNTSWLVIQYITAGDSMYFYFNTEAQHFGLFVVHSTIITVMQLLRSWLGEYLKLHHSSLVILTLNTSLVLCTRDVLGVSITCDS